MTQLFFNAGIVLFGTAIALSLVRVFKGPTLPDRVVAFDVIGVNLISIAAVLSVILRTKAFLEVILIIAILAFISTVAFSKYIERGVIIDRKRNR
ncbi:Na(+)/H(+) antiporter subunit F1 [Domibacillus enclensis]|uniref:Multisubunit sodium/proton antiporter, MrpF subunit n=1 Tax=Domibacillus enclensis TaxID=1017273 RepID=A0A1N6SSW8_9BACI|nr:Na(+)/H(+) antiporter subunit F1 [Domibacillus enclensis]OXS79409.1 Na(+)/H(+) antiporter subunit F [Domibacillus enclensis]SIQ44220.1 multisubunit sodium/proton antiporter, MrpF subunit [Domibacillus enclensis]